MYDTNLRDRAVWPSDLRGLEVAQRGFEVHFRYIVATCESKGNGLIVGKRKWKKEGEAYYI